VRNDQTDTLRIFTDPFLGCCAALLASLACCCCLDLLF
jgi:hypothetical protein